MRLFLGLHRGLIKEYLETTYLSILVGMPEDFVSNGICKGLLMGLQKRLFKDYIGSYLSKFDLDERVPRVLHRTYHKGC
jgi:hypothetical protein